MKKQVIVEWNSATPKGTIDVINGEFVSAHIVKGSGEIRDNYFSFRSSGESRIAIELNHANVSEGSEATIVTINCENNPFTFFLRDVSAQYPIYIPAYEVIVTESNDGRSYKQIEKDIQSMGLVTNLQQINNEKEETYEIAKQHTLDLPCQTWLGLSRDVRIFGIGFRGVGADTRQERIWDWVQPRFHGKEVPLPENNNNPVAYQYMIGRGVGSVQDISRRLEDGVVPILHAKIHDEEISYHSTSFVSLEVSPLSKDSVNGTNYLVADGFGHGHMLTEEQESLRETLLDSEMNQEEEVVLYSRIEAVNTGNVPRYAWFKNIIPNGQVQSHDGLPYTFDGENGLGIYDTGRVFSVSKLNGKPLSQEEVAILLKPGESATFEFYLPNRPVSKDRAIKLRKQNFTDKHQECRNYWNEKLNSGAKVSLPEQRIHEMLQAGLLHLDLVSYGSEPEGTIVPTIGVYTAIGSESAPIIQFMDSMGWHDIAKRALNFFLDKQHDDGFIQNFGGYMLETGAALWSIGEHYRYTGDQEWIDEIKPKLLKSYQFINEWRQRNLVDNLKGNGYGMLEGKTADPEDPFHSFMLNGYAYLGLSRLAEILVESDPDKSEEILSVANALKDDIHDSFNQAMAKSPVVPLGDGTWIPTVPPWTEYSGPLALFAEGGKWLTHGSMVARDSLLGPLWLVAQEVIDANDVRTDFMLQFHNELMCTRNVALSQPYYSPHPWIHLKRDEVKPFLKSFYNGFSGLADRETYTFWEHYWHASPHKTHEEGWFLMQIRWMLYMEKGDDLHLLKGVPRAWLEDGKKIELNNIATYFGKLQVNVESNIVQGTIIADISCENDKMPKTVSIRLPHPEGRVPVEIIGGEYSPEKESVVIPEFSGKQRVVLKFNK